MSPELGLHSGSLPSRLPSLFLARLSSFACFLLQFWLNALIFPGTTTLRSNKAIVRGSAASPLNDYVVTATSPMEELQVLQPLRRWFNICQGPPLHF